MTAHSKRRSTSVPAGGRSVGKISYFSNLDRAVVADVARAVRQRDWLTASTRSWRRNCDGLYFCRPRPGRLVKTSAEGREHVVRVLGPGATFNDVAVFDGGPNSDSVRRGRTDDGRFVPAATMTALIERHPSVAKAASRYCRQGSARSAS